MSEKRLNFWLGTAIVLACVWLGVRADGADLPRTYVTTYTPTTISDFPGSIAASATVTNYVWLDVRRHDVVSFQIDGLLTATNPAAATLTIPVHRSIDGVTAESTAVNGVILTFTGTAPKTFTTNINTGGLGYLRIGPSIVSSATNVGTNLVLKFSGKPPWALTTPYQTGPQ